MSDAILIQFNPSATRTTKKEGERGDDVDSRRRVGNGVARGYVDVDDDRRMLVQEPKQPEHYSTCNQNVKS